MKNNPLQIAITRGPLVESSHLVDAVVIDANGKIIAEYGLGGSLKTFPRSAIKIFQAIPLVQSGAVEQYELGTEYLALACASHFGEDKHTELVKSWMSKLQISEDQFACAAHLPLGEKAQQTFWQSGQGLHRWHNNCSGKHCGLLTAAKQQQISTKNYQHYDHPLQKQLRQILSVLSAEDMTSARWGVDGCELPTYETSLLALARMWSRLLEDNLQAGSSDQNFEPYRLPLQKLKSAMILHPELVGGQGSMCTDVIAATKGAVLIKIGAEGVYAGLMEHSGLAFALKVRDGHMRASKAALAYLVDSFNGFTETQRSVLIQYMTPPVTTWGGQIVGKIKVQSSDTGV